MTETPKSGGIDLSGAWALSDADGDHLLDMSVPGDVITALQQAGQIADPYFGRNEYQTRWIANRDWTIRREVQVSATDMDLVLSQLDCIATVRVNEVVVLKAENAFRSYRVPLNDTLVVGKNTLEITFHSNPAIAAERQAQQPYVVPWHKGNCPIPNGNMLRKPQCDFGWDWNIALAPFGIYGDLRLEPQRALRIAAIDIEQDHSNSEVRVAVSVRVAGDGPEQSCTITLGHQTVEGQVDAITPFQAAFELSEPELWWPAGQGGQPLLNLTVEVDGQTEHRRLGLCDIRLVNEPDDAGLGFKLRVNGRDVFCKGANWIPADALPGRITRQATRDLLQSAVDANMNMIRVWGGGRYEPDWFYDICDELGLMVWQDFMFACNLYPATDSFLAEVDAEVREVVDRLAHRTCIALWCGDNELIGALNWFEESVRDRDRYLVAYDRLNRTIERALKDRCPSANWWPSSPSPGPMSFGDAWHDDGSGDMHFWSVWHEGRDFDHYRDVAPRFCSEFGFQSYPSTDVIRRFASEDELNIASPVMESHQKNAGGNARIAETLFRYFRFPGGFDDFVYLSQVQQGLAIQTAVSHWRALKPHCMGTLYWQLNDTWPVASWSSLDYGGGWKLLHHMARRFYAPIWISVVPDNTGFGFRAVNDTGVETDLAWQLGAVRMDGVERQIHSSTHRASPERSDPLWHLPANDVAEDEVLLLRWNSDHGTGCEHFAQNAYKTYDLAPSGLGLTSHRKGAGWQVQLSAKALSLFATVEADQPGRFSDNAVTVLPDQAVTLHFSPDDPDAPVRFRTRDLYSATYARNT